MRISHLDGLRGVAILLVFFYHAFARWGEIMPYGQNLADFPLFQYGKYGVQLFFLLSGFVVYMTLDRSHSALLFLYKRWLRLLPAMLICSIVIFLTAPIFFARPAGDPRLVDLLPGISLIEPYYLSLITGLKFNPLEGSFWSIYVEVKFYLFAAFVYFFVSKNKLPWFIFGAFIFWVIIVKAPIVSEWNAIEPLRWRLHFTSIEHFGWFACGCFCYQYKFQNDVRKLYYAIISVAICIAVASNGSLALSIALTCFVALFIISLISSPLQRALSSRIFLFYGFISYPLYLLHENLLISAVIQMATYMPTVPAFIWPIVLLAAISIVAFLIAKYAEPLVRFRLTLPVAKKPRTVS